VSPRSVGALADRQIRMERAGDSRRKASGDAPRIRHVVARLGVALRATLFRAFAGCVDPHTGRGVGGPRPRTDARMPCAGNLVGTLWWKLGIGDRGVSALTFRIFIRSYAQQPAFVASLSGGTKYYWCHSK
jgi:hypothetical protein